MKFGKLKILGISKKEGFVECLCDCGIKCQKFLANIKRGNISSCGCKQGESHGKSRDPEWIETYHSWQHMKSRCSNKKEMYFHNYGGRGIKVCDKWIHSFEAFILDMGKRPSGCTLDRIDNNGMYSAENCRWATKLEQDNNRRRTVRVSVRGVIMSFTQAHRLLGFSYWKEYAKIRSNKKTPQQCINEFIGC